MSSDQGTALCEMAEANGAKAVLHRDIECVLPNLRRYARSLTHDDVDADDLVQECLARALSKLHLWKVGTDLRAWLFSILHNEYVSQIRRAARRRTAVDWSEYGLTLTCAPTQIEHMEIRDLIRGLKSLPEEQRDAVLMISLTSDYYEAASACKVPLGTIRSRLSRGRKALRAMTGMASGEPRIANRCAGRA